MEGSCGLALSRVNDHLETIVVVPLSSTLNAHRYLFSLKMAVANLYLDPQIRVGRNTRDEVPAAGR